MATNTCGPALDQVQQGHRRPQKHRILILTSLLAGDKRGGQHCRGNREGNSPVGEVFTVFLPDLLVLSPQHTPPSFQKKFFIPCNTPSSFSNRSPPWCSVTCAWATGSKPALPPLSWRHAAGHPLPAWYQISSPCFQDQPSERFYFSSLTVFSIFPLARSSAYKGKIPDSLHLWGLTEPGTRIFHTLVVTLLGEQASFRRKATSLARK